MGGAVIGEDSHRIFEISLSSPLEMSWPNIDKISEVFSFPPSFHKVWRQDRIPESLSHGVRHWDTQGDCWKVTQVASGQKREGLTQGSEFRMMLLVSARRFSPEWISFDL